MHGHYVQKKENKTGQHAKEDLRDLNNRWRVVKQETTKCARLSEEGEKFF